MDMQNLESSRHLFQRPFYRSEGNGWRDDFEQSLREFTGELTWDPAGVLSAFSFGYPSGNRTLVQEITRQPWMSDPGENGSVHLENLPPHGRQWEDQDHVAERLEDLLCREAEEVCKEAPKVYILLSGGLDSRIVAGILQKLRQQDRITSDIIAVTWGPENCRDVIYARYLSEIMGFQWQYAPFDWTHLDYNITNFSTITGGFVSPIHFHRMDWFQDVEKDALVLAGSYGDSVGRGEYFGRHLVELEYIKPLNLFSLFNRGLEAEGVQGIKQDLNQLRSRCGRRHQYALCECELESHYMRNMLAHTMASVINHHCRLYQMFTHPDVYSYVWSLHPCLRDDGIYLRLLRRLDPRLTSMPWARTARALEGPTVSISKEKLVKNFHDYKKWVSGPIYRKYGDYVDPKWFVDTGLFERKSVERLCGWIKNKFELYDLVPYDRWLWLISFRKTVELMEKMGKRPSLPETEAAATKILPNFRYRTGVLRTLLSVNSRTYNLVKTATMPIRNKRKMNRRKMLKEQLLAEIPPVRSIREEERV